MLAEPEEHRRGKWDVLMLSRELRSKYSGEVESRMPLQTARTGSERGVRHEAVRLAVRAEDSASHLGFCPQYPTKTCGWSNPAV